MHWLHQTTENFIDWTLEGCALAPDQDYDHAGVFSGSAIEKDGKHFLMYTGVRKDENGEFQQQCLAIGDGKNYEKLKNNPVIPTSLILRDFLKFIFGILKCGKKEIDILWSAAHWMKKDRDRLFCFHRMI